MAGIGFVLRKLARQDNLIGILRAYAHSAVASTGPWLFTVLSLGFMMAVGNYFISMELLFTFRIIIIYNFAFSLVFSGPIFMVATRYLADCIYRKDVSTAPGMMMGAMALLFATQLPIVCWFYLVYANLTLGMALSAIVNFMMISSIWLISVFISALKDYNAITQAFALGLTLAVLVAGAFAKFYGPTGMLNGFSVGLIFITGSLMARVFAEYPYRFKSPFAFMPYFKKYWEIALGGMIYNIAAWVDKWVMWFAPEAEKMESNLLLYANYDSAMFAAFLTIVPSMAIFIFSIETSFFEHYLAFYRDIQNKATFAKIQKNHEAMIKSILSSGRNFLILQGTICGLTIMMAPRIFEAVGINFLQIGIFRYGVLGALFHILTMFLNILLSYFDNRKDTLMIQVIFMCTNCGFTIVTMNLGFAYYGYGYFLASLLTFVITAVITARYITKLPYHTFITTNTSV